MASWSGRGVGIGQVDDALLDLRRGEERAATRISTINLVVVAEDDADAARARNAMRQLGGRNPGRTVILMPDSAADPHVDAQVRLYHATVDACPVWWEEVQIKVGGPAGDHLDSLVEPLTLGDLPVTVWYPSAVPDPAEPLVGAADVVVVESPPQPGEGGPTAGDTADGPVADVFSRLLELAQRRPLIDLSWIRLTPWRRLLVTLFDAGDFRHFAGVVDRAEVAARPGSAMLLAGWLEDRLELPASSVSRRSASDATITLVASGGGGIGRFSVAREEDDGFLTAVAEIEGGPRRQDAVTLPEDPLAAALAEALTCVRHDRIYEMAIGAALGTHR
ncbi:MAG TPA: glucose-6-phosphate dehydrogenase assembly protein OpcA [Acidimicrobiales bacterium]|nr:glucose-6-phosphate dehydrogenase assembly protein OpcA [Acidimicrobiales bacterium]